MGHHTTVPTPCPLGPVWGACTGARGLHHMNGDSLRSWVRVSRWWRHSSPGDAPAAHRPEGLSHSHPVCEASTRSCTAKMRRPRLQRGSRRAPQPWQSWQHQAGSSDLEPSAWGRALARIWKGWGKKRCFQETPTGTHLPGPQDHAWSLGGSAGVPGQLPQAAGVTPALWPKPASATCCLLPDLDRRAPEEQAQTVSTEQGRCYRAGRPQKLAGIVSLDKLVPAIPFSQQGD